MREQERQINTRKRCRNTVVEWHSHTHKLATSLFTMCTPVHPFTYLRMCDIPCHDQRAGQLQPCANGESAQLRQDFLHRSVEIDLHGFVRQCGFGHFRQVLTGVGFQLFQIDTARGNLPDGLAIWEGKAA